MTWPFGWFRVWYSGQPPFDRELYENAEQHAYIQLYRVRHGIEVDLSDERLAQVLAEWRPEITNPEEGEQT
jgi:hypothetical protein